MAAIYNLEFTRVDTQLSIYLDGRLRATKFVDQHMKMNSRFQFYVENGRPVCLTIVLYALTDLKSYNPSDHPKVAFTLQKTGEKRPVAMVHYNLIASHGQQVNLKEYSFMLK